MHLFPFILVPLLLVVIVSFVVARSLKTAPGTVTLVVVPLTMLAGLCVTFVFSGLPDAADIAMESVTIFMADHHADDAMLEGWFRATGADWHSGEAWEPGESFSSLPTPCRLNCAKEWQVAYPQWVGLCVIGGDRITIHFDGQRKVESWSIDPAVDGC